MCEGEEGKILKETWSSRVNGKVPSTFGVQK